MFCVISWAAWRLGRRFPALPCTWLAYLFVITPLSGIVQNGRQMIADRYSYISCLPFALLAGALSLLAIRLIPHPSKRVFLALLACAAGVIGVLGMMTWSQTLFWRDDISLWSYAARLDPHSATAEGFLGTAFLRVNRFSAALAAYQEALRYRQDDPLVYDMAATALSRLGRLDDALRYRDRALAIDPRYVQGYVNRGLTHLLLGHSEEATVDFRRALALDARNEGALINLGAAYGNAGRYDEALRYQSQDVEFHPDSLQARLNLGVTLRRMGRVRDAAQQFSQALRLDPKNQLARQSLSEAEK
jgi:tetratricopeptide (TPR) repeat protein